MPVIDGSLSDCRYQKVVAQGAADPEPRVVLGVLYNLSKEFDEAADVLREAVKLAPDDYTLWNKVIRY